MVLQLERSCFRHPLVLNRAERRVKSSDKLLFDSERIGTARAPSRLGVMEDSESEHETKRRTQANRGAVDDMSAFIASESRFWGQVHGKYGW